MKTITLNASKGYILPGEPVGIMTTVGPTEAYFSPGPTSQDSQTTSPTRAIIFFTDIFGIPLKNCKIMADHFAGELGCDVWVPDLFDGAPLLTSEEMNRPDRPGQRRTYMESLASVWLGVSRINRIYAIRSSTVDPTILNFVHKIKQDKSYERLGAVGYSYGASVAIRLSPTNIFDTLVLAHPGSGNLQQVQAIKVPCSWIMAEEDERFPKSLQHQCETEFASRKGKDNFVDFEFKEYQGTTHGFAARPNLELDDIRESFEAALLQAVNWLRKTL